jgi:hypothetical protein
MDRRNFLRAGVVSTGAGVMLPTAMFARPASARSAEGSATAGESPYGPLSDTPDENGLLLPAGFTSRVIAVGGELVGETDYEWHIFPDGAGTFDDGNGGWYYTCNSEVFDFMAADSGGVSAVHFDADGNIVDAYRILEGSNSNCAGGPTPWGTWLSGEENFSGIGRIWECDPTGAKPAVAHEAMGRWAHEAAAVDPDNQQVYLTEDNSAGLFYRYTPTAYPDLSAGKLEACIVAADGSVSWGPLTDPSGATVPTREQVAGATIFPGNEGCWYHQGWVYFTSKGDHSVHGIDIAAQKYTLLWKGDPDGLGVEGAVLSHVDNITVDAGSGDLFVAEDGGNMELVIITPEGALAPFVRVVGEGHADSEMTGPVFNPSRDRLYFSSQRGPSVKTPTEIVAGAVAVPEGPQAGVTYEITGPFRGVMTITDAAPPETEAPTATIASPVDTLVGAAPNTQDAEPVSDEDSGSGGDKSKLVVGVVVAAAAVGGVVAFRKRRIDEASGENTSGR